MTEKPADPSRTAPAKSVSEIDRLIDLARDAPSPALQSEEMHALSLEDKKDPRPSMWRVLLQLRVLLPYLSRLLPLMEATVGRSLGSRPELHLDTSHFDSGLDGLESTQRELAAQIQGQSSDIRQMQEQLAALNSAAEAARRRQEELASTIQGMRKLLLAVLITAPVLLLVIIGMLVFMLGGSPRLAILMR